MVLLAVPGRVLQAGGGGNTPAVRVGVRILGARHLAEAVVLSRARSDRPLRWIIAVDLIHAASMLWLAADSPRMRRDALLSAASAGTLAALSARYRGTPDAGLDRVGRFERRAAG
jgi:hypothetical protein